MRTALLLLLATAPAAAQQPELANPVEFNRTIRAGVPESLAGVKLGTPVQVRVFVGADGQADTVQSTSSGHSGLDGVISSAARAARYTGAGWAEFAVGIPERVNAPVVVAIPVVDRDSLGSYALYPEQLRRERIGGAIPVLVAVGPDGGVLAARVLETSCHTELNGAAADIAKRVQFEGDGSPRATLMTVTFGRDSVHIRLQGDSVRSWQSPPPRQTRRPELRNATVVQQELVRAYPPHLRDRGVGGEVKLWLWVNEQGRVDGRNIAVSSGLCDLDLAAFRVARQLRFSPAVLDGEHVGVWIEIPFRFTAR